MLIVVAGVLRDNDMRVCLTKRQSGDYKDLWEFPGGKVNANETTIEALCRELKEELGIDVLPSQGDPLWFTSDKEIVLLFYTIKIWRGIAYGKEGQELKWFLPEEMKCLKMPPLDEDVKLHISFTST